MNTIHHGSCLCKGIRFSVDGPLAPVQLCHCSQCRHGQGGPFATNIPVSADSVRFLQGEDLLQFHESSPGKFRAFCRVCGSPVYSRRDSLPGVMRIRVGLLDEPVPLTLGFHIFATSNAAWWPILDTLPRYDERAPATPPSARKFS